MKPKHIIPFVYLGSRVLVEMAGRRGGVTQYSIIYP